MKRNKRKPPKRNRAVGCHLPATLVVHRPAPARVCVHACEALQRRLASMKRGTLYDVVGELVIIATGGRTMSDREVVKAFDQVAAPVLRLRREEPRLRLVPA